MKILYYNLILLAKKIECAVWTSKQNGEVKRAFGESYSLIDLDRFDGYKRYLFLLLPVLFFLFKTTGRQPAREVPLAVVKNVSQVEKERVAMIEQKEVKEEKKIEKGLFYGSEYVLLFSKREKKLVLLNNTNEGRLSVVKTFNASYGKVSGDKQVEGDLKTPEGIYEIVQIKPKNELSKIFGPMAFVLNYPNEFDKKAGKTGSNIWIHGTGIGDITPDTKGCVEISDNDIIALSSYIRPGTPVVIFSENYTFKGEIDRHLIKESRIQDILAAEAKI